jgi:hypothetical protein
MQDVTGVVQNSEVARVQDLILTEIVSPIIGLCSAIAFAMFAYGMVKFLYNRARGDSGSLEDGKKHLIYGTLGLIVMFSMWGILIWIAKMTGSKIWFLG